MYTIEEIYNQTIRVSRNLVEDIRFGRQLYLEPVEMCSMQICKCLNDEADILTFLHSVHDNHPYIISHPANMVFLSYVIGKWMNLDQSKLENLVLTGLLHDIGKAKIKDSILNKTEALTLEEADKLKTHPVIGYKILDSLNMFDKEVLYGVLFHHEKMDGTGYPLGLKADKINLFSRIIAIAGTFDAITATNTYRDRNTPLKAIEEIQASSLNHLDPQICQIFMDHIIEYYKGREIRLSNDRVGVIVYIDPVSITKPLVHYDNENHDLSIEKDIEIVEVL